MHKFLFYSLFSKQLIFFTNICIPLLTSMLQLYFLLGISFKRRLKPLVSLWVLYEGSAKALWRTTVCMICQAKQISATFLIDWKSQARGKYVWSSLLATLQFQSQAMQTCKQFQKNWALGEPDNAFLCCFPSAQLFLFRPLPLWSLWLTLW